MFLWSRLLKPILLTDQQYLRMECNQGKAPTGSTGTPPVILGAWECD